MEDEIIPLQIPSSMKPGEAAKGSAAIAPAGIAAIGGPSFFSDPLKTEFPFTGELHSCRICQVSFPIRKAKKPCFV
jgi:hypothetical protein